MDAQEKEERKKRVLAYACKASFPVTPSEVSDELDINMQTVQGLLFELVFEKHLQFVIRGCHRYFFPVPDKKLTIINQKEQKKGDGNMIVEAEEEEESDDEDEEEDEEED